MEENSTKEFSRFCIVSRNFLVWDGKSDVPRQEFDLEKNTRTKGLSFIHLTKRFYVYKGYSSEHKYFYFCVLIGEEKEIADKYLATMEVFHEVKEVSTSITCPVMPLEDFPESTLGMNRNPSIWKIPFEMMRNLFGIKESKSGNGWKLFFKWKVTMKKKKTVL